MTDYDVGVCRNRARQGVWISVLAREYGVSRQSMRKAVYGQTYKDCKVAPLPPVNGRPAINRKLDAKGVRNMRRYHAKGWSTRDLAAEHKLSEKAVRDCVNRVTYRDIE